MTGNSINNWDKPWKSDSSKIPLKLALGYSTIDGSRFWLDFGPEEELDDLRLKEYLDEYEYSTGLKDRVMYMVGYNSWDKAQSEQQLKEKYNSRFNHKGTLLTTYTHGTADPPTTILMDVSMFGTFDMSQNPPLFVAGDEFYNSEKYFYLHNNRITYEHPITNKVYELVRVRIKYEGKDKYEFLTWAGNEIRTEDMDIEWISGFLENEASYALTDTVKLSEWYQAISSSIFSSKVEIVVEDVYVYTDFDG